MPLAAGEKLGPYQIVAPLGAGGMGEVYRARDTRLGREVALKVLPAGLAADPERRRRFEQEARAVAALNHPNILSIFDVGIGDGALEERAFLVSELLNGQTLRQRLAGGALAARKVADYGAQIAAGLAAAHAQGIVHRDLKPENIFITADDRVKILDFGLAKPAEGVLAAVSGDGDGVSSAPTLPASTVPGMVLGTVGYMAPEQARGQAADARSDIFSLGAVLYEMASGRRAFHGASGVETLHAIIHAEPPEPTAGGRDLPPALTRIIERCLQKSPERRLQSAQDLSFALETLTAAGSSTQLGALPPAPRRSGGRVPAWWLPAAAVAAGLAAAGAVWWARGGGVARAHWRFTAITSYAGVQADPALSPDGRSVAFVSNRGGHFNVYISLTGGGRPVAITRGTHLKTHPAWSPRGTTIAFARLNHSGLWDIWEVPALGGPARRVILNGFDPSFAPDGRLVYASNADGNIWEAGALGQNPRLLAAAPRGYSWTAGPRISPNGRLLAFTAMHQSGGPYGTLAVANLATGKTRLLPRAGAFALSAAWGPRSRTIYFASNRAGAMNLWRIDADGRGLAQITAGQGDDSELDISADGKRILFGTIHMDMALAELELGPSQPPHALRVLDVDPARWLWAPEYSPDGKQLAFFTALKGVDAEGIGIANSDGSGAVELAHDQWQQIFPRWTADGRKLVYWSVHSRSDEIRAVPAAGGSPQTLVRQAIAFYPVPGRDGRILFLGAARIHGRVGPLRFEVMDPHTGMTRILGAAPAMTRQVVWSPRQNRIAYLTTAARDDDPQAGVWVGDFRSPPRQVFRGWAVAISAGHGNHLYVLAGAPDLTTVLWKMGWNGRGLTRVTGRIPPTWGAGFLDFIVGGYFDVAPGGKQVVCEVQPGLAENIGMLTRMPAGSR